MPPRPRLNASIEDIRSVLTAAFLREIMGTTDGARASLVTIESSEHTGDRDVVVTGRDVVTSLSVHGRLHVPQNMLWRKPVDSQTALYVESPNAAGPGAGYMLWGDASDAGDEFPPWFDTEAGIYAKGKIRVQSKDDDTTVESGPGKYVKLGEAATNFVALANLVSSQLSALKSAIQGAGVVPGDGGAAFKAAIIAALSTWPGSVASSKTKSE